MIGFKIDILFIIFNKYKENIYSILGIKIGGIGVI